MAHDMTPTAGLAAVAARSRPIELPLILVVTGTVEKPQATVTVTRDGKDETSQQTGNGPVDALFKAINAAARISIDGMQLTSYSVRSEGKGMEAVAYVKVCLERGLHTYSGAYRHVDTIVASGRAYVDALNKLLAAT